MCTLADVITGAPVSGAADLARVRFEKSGKWFIISVLAAVFHLLLKKQSIFTVSDIQLQEKTYQLRSLMK